MDAAASAAFSVVARERLAMGVFRRGARAPGDGLFPAWASAL